MTIDGESPSAVTNAVGRFEISGVPAGVAALAVQAPGYLELQVPDVQVTAGAATPVTIELAATPSRAWTELGPLRPDRHRGRGQRPHG